MASALKPGGWAPRTALPLCLLAGTGGGCGATPPAASGSASPVASASLGDGASGPGAASGDDDEDGAPAGQDAGTPGPEAGYPVGDGGLVIRADRFVTTVVSFTPTDCTGFGQASMPGIVEGPPVGGGTGHGSTDVVSLGSGGSIVVSFAPNAIVDGPGADFIVFENPFWIGGNPNDPYAEPGQVSVSDDGVTWSAFPCTPTIDPQAGDGTGVAGPYGSCGGWQIVYSNPENGISPVDPSVAGGLALDLATVGLVHARYVKIVDQTQEDCPEAGPRPDTNGFDLDAVAIIHAELP
jgi:hypothetical protein